MGAFVKVGGVIATAIMLLASALMMPAHAQDPYPPPPPPPPPAPASVECDLEGQGRDVACEGERFQPGSTVTLQLHRQGPPANNASGGNVVGTGTAPVDGNGEFTVSAQLDCNYTNDRVRAQVRGTDARGNQRNFSQTVNVSDADPCPGTGVLGAGETASLTDDGDGSALDVLARTGVQLMALILLALALIAAGTLLVLRRRNRHAPS